MAGAALASVAAAAPEGDSLEELARKKGLHFGTALNSRGLRDSDYLALVRAQCGLIVPENELKMPAIQPRAGEFHFERADAILKFAEDNDLRTRGHTLLWH